MGMRATVIQYLINVRTPKEIKSRTKLEKEQIWNGFKIYQHNYFLGVIKTTILERSECKTAYPFPQIPTFTVK